MRLPKKVLNVAAAAPKERTRYGCDGVYIERKDNRIRAAATDGRQLLVVKWSDDATSPLKGFEGSDKAVDGFSTIIPSSELKLAMAGAQKPKKVQGQKHAPEPCILLDESSCNGHVSLIVPREESVHRVEVKTIEQQFPRFDEVIPDYEIIKHADAKPLKGVRIAVDGVRLMSLLSVLLDCTGDKMDRRNAVVIDIPTTPNRPIKLTRGNDNSPVSATAVLMPVIMDL